MPPPQSQFVKQYGLWSRPLPPCELGIRPKVIAGTSIGAIFAAARLRKALTHATDSLAALTAGVPALGASLRAAFQESARGMHSLLNTATVPDSLPDPERVLNWFLAQPRSVAYRDKAELPDLFELDSGGISLANAQFLGLYMLKCRLITKMVGARFVDADIRCSDFKFADLERSLWSRTEIHQCCFAESSFVDASFDGVTFVDCDLSGAHIAVTRRGRDVMTGVHFLRCDLRDVIWHGRDLSRVVMLQCETDDTSELDEKPNLVPASQRSAASAPVQTL